MIYTHSKKNTELEKLENERREQDTSRPDPNQDVEEILNETQEEKRKKAETPEEKEERKQELERRKMERGTQSTKRAIYYPGDDQ